MHTPSVQVFLLLIEPAFSHVLHLNCHGYNAVGAATNQQALLGTSLQVQFRCGALPPIATDCGACLAIDSGCSSSGISLACNSVQCPARELCYGRWFARVLFCKLGLLRSIKSVINGTPDCFLVSAQNHLFWEAFLAWQSNPTYCLLVTDSKVQSPKSK